MNENSIYTVTIYSTAAVTIYCRMPKLIYKESVETERNINRFINKDMLD